MEAGEAPNMAGGCSLDDVRAVLRHHVIWLGNPKLKVEAKAEADGRTIIGEIVTEERMLVQRFEVDRQSGIVSDVSQRAHYDAARRH